MPDPDIEATDGGLLSALRCRAAAEAALAELPQEFLERMGEVSVIVEDSHPEGLMGIYDPVGGIERIVVFRDANPSEEEVRKTVLHEVGHFFGMDEEALRRAGYG
jgi:predicted Zn-dependent protease with MMP-like domain